jgi:hypothetical protein
MKKKAIGTILVAAVIAATTISAAPQGSKTESANRNESQSTTMPQGMMGHDAMSGGSMGMMGQMSAHHQEMSKLMDQMMQNMTAMRGETNPAALKGMMGEQEALLKKMHDQMMQHEGMMTKMHQMMSDHEGMGCPSAPSK